MNRLHRFYRSTVGKKQLMAVSGIILVIFVIAHMLGHLQMFVGRQQYNAYAASLKSLGPLLWLARISLFVFVATHITSAIQLVRRNRRARPQPYLTKKDHATTFAARTMAWGGPLLLAFIVYHLLHHTFLVTGPGYSPTDIYGNMVVGFQVLPITIVYLIAIALLGLHIYHGFWSMLQTLGLKYPAIAPWRTVIAPAVAVIVTIGYMSVPLAIYFGWIY